jgi:hypothetical protein
MDKFVLIIILGILLAIALPFSQGDTERRYLDITEVTINFENTDARFTVQYELGTLPKLYILLFGSRSLEQRIQGIFADFRYEVIRIDENEAILEMKNISRLENGYYLHDSIKFGETLRSVNIITPDSPRPREYTMINNTPNIFYRY